MAEYKDDFRRILWNRLRTVRGKKSDYFRLDAAGALIEWSKYGDNSPNGWQIDHACPKKILGDNGIKEEDMDYIEDLRPFNTANNELKGDDFPKYTRAVYFDENTGENVEDRHSAYIVNREVQKKVMRHFSLPITLFGNGSANTRQTIEDYLNG